jgi:hypothetical protein
MKESRKLSWRSFGDSTDRGHYNAIGLPDLPCIEIENASRFGLEVRIARKDPRCCHGRMASSCNHRPDTGPTISIVVN